MNEHNKSEQNCPLDINEFSDGTLRPMICRLPPPIVLDRIEPVEIPIRMYEATDEEWELYKKDFSKCYEHGEESSRFIWRAFNYI